MPSPPLASRRRFLQASAAVAAAITAPAVVRGRNLNSKLQLAGIGAEGKGWSDISEMASHAQVQFVAFCDVDLARTDKVRALAPEAAVFQDYRILLDKLGDQVDAVTVSTPDHTHACISIEAMRRGKHVYCQKPLTRTVWEARQMRLWAAKSGVITRMGNQIHSHAVYRTAMKLIQSGALGKIRAIHSWVGTTGHGRSGLLNRPARNEAVPSSLHWELWVGGAPMRDYGGQRVYHPFAWRDWQDFGSGAIGDFGCHLLDPVYTALKITGDPISVVSEHTGMNDEVWPAQETLQYVVPGTEYTADKTLPITWYDGGRRPGLDIAKPALGQHLPASGSGFASPGALGGSFDFQMDNTGGVGFSPAPLPVCSPCSGSLQGTARVRTPAGGGPGTVIGSFSGPVVGGGTVSGAFQGNGSFTSGGSTSVGTLNLSIRGGMAGFPIKLTTD